MVSPFSSREASSNARLDSCMQMIVPAKHLDAHSNMELSASKSDKLWPLRCDGCSTIGMSLVISSSWLRNQRRQNRRQHCVRIYLKS